MPDHERESATRMTDRSEQVGGRHYADAPVQPWDVIDTWPREQRIGYYRGNALKYLMRFGSKDDPRQEALKAEHYCRKLIATLEDARDR